MRTLETTYLGLKLKNPIIIGSSGLTNTAEKNAALEKAGAGAIVLKSLFEEQITMNSDKITHHEDFPEAYDYIRNYVHSQNIEDYLKLIRETKKVCTIPVIASINCYKKGEWAEFAKQIEAAGADAIELNIFMLNTEKHSDSNSFELAYVEIVEHVRKAVSLPISVKIGQQFTSLVSLANQIIAAGANSIVLFNRFHQPDINIKTLEVRLGNTFSSPSEFPNTLRWTSIITGMLNHVEVASSTGIHDWENAIKAILVGAQAVEICSAVYKHGNDIISEITTCMESWMEQQGYLNLEEFRGKLNYSREESRTIYERAQFMKYYADDKRNSGEIYFS